MIPFSLALAVTSWGLASRFLFRYWIRNDTVIVGTAARCSHGFTSLHLEQACHPSGGPADRGTVAALAVAAVLLLPVTLFIILVMHSPPLGARELAEKTRMLQEENDRLRRQQERELPVLLSGHNQVMSRLRNPHAHDHPE